MSDHDKVPDQPVSPKNELEEIVQISTAKKGDRIAFSSKWINALPEHNKKSARQKTGIIVGFSRAHNQCVRIRIDGKKTVHSYHHSFLKRIKDTEYSKEQTDIHADQHPDGNPEEMKRRTEKILKEHFPEGF